MKKDFLITPLLCAALGAAFGYYSVLMTQGIVGVTCILLAVLCLFRVLSELCPESRKLQLTAVCGAVLTAGFVIGNCASIAGGNVIRFGIPEEKITAIEGILLEDPRIISGGRAMAVLSLSKCADNKMRVSSNGEITVFFPPEGALALREYGRGTTVFAEGKLRATTDSAQQKNAGWTFTAKSMHITQKASAVERMRTGVRLNLIKRFEGKTWGGLALAMIIGIKDNLDSNLAVMYRNAGLSYILALSGMHLAIFATLIAFLLKKPLGLKAASITGAVIICIYCFIVGPMPSLNRAAIMYLLGVIAILGALPKDSISILSLSFLIQIIISPASGKTISFILSYTALVGILLTGKAFTSLLSGKVPDFLLQPLSMSCGAFLATAGICCYSFGYLAPAGIIAGLLIVPLSTIFMIGSLVWLVFDLFSISGFFSYAMAFIYKILERTASFAGKLHGISSVSPLLIFIVTIILSLLIVILEIKRKDEMLSLQTFS